MRQTVPYTLLKKNWINRRICNLPEQPTETESFRAQVMQINHIPENSNDNARLLISDGFNYIPIFLPPNTLTDYSNSKPFCPIPQLRGSMIELSYIKFGKCKAVKKFYISVGRMRVIGLQGQGATLFGAPHAHYEVEEVRQKWEELTKQEVGGTPSSSSGSISSPDPAEMKVLLAIAEIMEGESQDPIALKNAIKNISKPDIQQDECEIPESQEVKLRQVPGWEGQEESLGFSQWDEKLNEVNNGKKQVTTEVVTTSISNNVEVNEDENKSIPDSPAQNEVEELLSLTQDFAFQADANTYQTQAPSPKRDLQYDDSDEENAQREYSSSLKNSSETAFFITQASPIRDKSDLYSQEEAEFLSQQVKDIFEEAISQVQHNQVGQKKRNLDLCYDELESLFCKIKPVKVDYSSWITKKPKNIVADSVTY